MKNKHVLFFAFILTILVGFSFKEKTTVTAYRAHYQSGLASLLQKQGELIKQLGVLELSPAGTKTIQQEINQVRLQLKSMDFWLRYLEPISYKKINGPLPVEWETEVFEKFEKPYKRDGAGLTLATLYLDEQNPAKDSLIHLLKLSYQATKIYNEDSITKHLNNFDHFYFCNRLYLLNLAAIYTTGFECPQTARIIPELKEMIKQVGLIYSHYNTSFPNQPLPQNYITLYEKMQAFVTEQSDDSETFDHFSFIKDYVNPLFSINQRLIFDYGASTNSYVDYALNKNCNSIFNKSLYAGQNTKGVYLRIYDAKTLSEIEVLGKTLFHDPILSGNNQRSCASCHNPASGFSDTVNSTAFAFNKSGRLPRNTPSLLNADYNHLLMLDGKHISLHNQAKDVITNPHEMACDEKEILAKVLSCAEYKAAFNRLLKRIPEEKEITTQHISSAIVYYYSRFSKYYSPFDRAMNNQAQLSEKAKRGFNLFMSKAQCATCHFVPQFNGVKPPYVGSEFEVLGVPADTLYTALSKDKGRYEVNPAKETLRAFRTGTLRNADKTKPYMHNGVFNTMEQVIEFYNTGGGEGHGLPVGNQTLSADSLRLTKNEKNDLMAFISSLNEDIPLETKPLALPKSKNKILNKRIPGGEY